MKDIRISPGAQIAALAVVGAAIVAAAVAQAPELKRYMKMESM